MAEFLDSANADVAAGIESSRSFFERLGATPYIERLDAAIARGGAPVATPKRGRAAATATPEVAVTE